MGSNIKNKYDSSKIYAPEEIDRLEQLWKLENSKVETKPWNGKQIYYRRYTSVLHHKNIDFWKFTTGLKAFAALFFSCGFALLSKTVKNLWHAAVTGNQILRIKVKVKEITQSSTNTNSKPSGTPPSNLIGINNEPRKVASSKFTTASDITSRVRDYMQGFEFANQQPFIEENHEKSIFHLRSPGQLYLFKDSPFAKAEDSSDYSAQYTTCGWVAAHLVDNLCRILTENNTIPREAIQSLLEQSGPDEFIRKSTDFVGDLTAYGGSCDKVEGLVLGVDIYAILKGTQPPSLENVFIIEGAAEEEELKINGEVLEVFNSTSSFKANYKSPSEFSSLKNAIIDVSSGKMPFVILVSMETFPIGQHFVTYVFRKNSQNLLECLILEGLNEPHSDWVLYDSNPDRKTQQLRSTTEWIYNELMLNCPAGIFSQTTGDMAPKNQTR